MIKEQKMIRKLLLVAAAGAVPIGLVAMGAVGSGVANAAKGPPPPSPTVNCALSGTINFAPPGLSFLGTTTSSKDNTTTVSGVSYSGCTGYTASSASSLSIVTKNSKCPKTTPNPDPYPAGCLKPLYYGDSVASFASAPLTTIEKSLKGLGLTVNGAVAKTKATSASEVEGTGGACGPSDGAGFLISGTAKVKPYAYTSFNLQICLSGDTGTNTTDNFFGDVASAALGGDQVIATATIDPTESFINLPGT